MVGKSPGNGDLPDLREGLWVPSDGARVARRAPVQVAVERISEPAPQESADTADPELN